MTVNCSIQAEELGNRARELKGLIDDSESVIFINLDRYNTHNINIQLNIFNIEIFLTNFVDTTNGTNHSNL